MNTMEHGAMCKSPKSATVDVEVTIFQGSEINDFHTVAGTVRKSTYFLELGMDNVKQKTCGRKAKKGRHDWDETFIFTANLSSCLSLKLYCKHGSVRSDHVIGEATCKFWDIPRHQNIQIDLHDPVKPRVSGKITVRLTVAATITFSTGPVPSLDLQSLYSINQMTKIAESLSVKDSNKLSPTWLRFIKSLDTVASNAQKISELHPPVQVALGAVAFALKAVLDGIARDERIDNMVGIMGGLHAYIADTYSIEKIASYKDTLRKVLVQTTECSYFIGDYRKVTDFAQRTAVNLVSNVDAMIQKFEDTFRDLKIELILGTSLQTAIVSFRILQKVENIETILYIEKLKPLEKVGWAPNRTCLRGTRNVIINDLVQWVSNSAKTETEESTTTNNARIYVLQGPPACGKSSIAHSVAEAFHLQNRLGAAIFLDERTEEQVIGSQILSTTIASQLAFYDPNIGAAIAAKIKVDVSLAKAEIERQFPGLIVSATKGLSLIGPICIIIDGIEKVADSDEQFRLLTAIADYIKQLPSNFRLLLTARHGRASEDIAQLLPDSVIKEITFDDEGIIVDYDQHISESLRHLFSKKSKLAGKYTIDDLREQFIKRSRGVYFWVSTACQFLSLCPDGDECAILENILSTEPPRTKEVVMDQLFRIILTYNPYIPLICQSFIRSSTPSPLQSPPPSVLVSNSTYFLSMMQGLGFLVETGRDGTDNPLFSIHPSLEDYLTSSRRCYGTDFYVDRLAPAPSLTWTMAEICFDLMAESLRQNICRLDDTMVLNREISDRAGRVRQYIPVVLQHACRNWIFHLEALDDSKRDSIHLAFGRLKTFLSNHLLHWIECMSLLGWVDVIPTSLDRLSCWLAVNHGILHDDDQQTLTQDAIQFIHAFAPIISKSAMQTYHSALPLMPSDSLLSQKYSDMSRLNLKSSGSKYSSIIHNPGVTLSTGSSVYNTTNSGDVMALSLAKGGIAFFDTRTGNEIGSKIPAADNCQLIAFSPSGRWIVTWSEDQRVLDIWNVQTRTHTKTIANESKDRHFRRVTYSTDGKKVMIVTSPNEQLTPHQLVFIWDVETDKPLKQLEVTRLAEEVTVSPDGSYLAIADNLGIEIIEVDTGHRIGRHITPYNDSSWSGWTYCSTPRLIWSPNGQFLASASLKRSGYFEETTIYLLSLNAKVSSMSRILGVFTTKYILDLTCSPDSSKVVAILGDVYNRSEMTLSIWCTRSGSLVGNTTFNLTNAGDSQAASIAFAANGRDILICNYDLYVDTQSTILLRFSVLPTHLETYMNHPSKFHPSQTPHTIQYSHYISGPIDNYASHVDSDGWILNTKGEREIWTPWADYELLCSCKPPPEGQTQYRTLEVKDPETKTVVLIYVIAFEQRDINTRIQEETASVEMRKSLEL